ncbi:MAG: hypothetical protein ACKO8I_18475 [Cyanobacteriota bacterium]
MSAILEAGSICRWAQGQGPAQRLGNSCHSYVVVLSPPTPGRTWLTVMPLGQPPEFLAHPLRPHLPLQGVQRIGAPDQRPPAALGQPPLLLGDRLLSVATEELEAPIARISAEQLHRTRQLGALALGLRPSDLRQPPSLG